MKTPRNENGEIETIHEIVKLQHQKRCGKRVCIFERNIRVQTLALKTEDTLHLLETLHACGVPDTSSYFEGSRISPGRHKASVDGSDEHLRHNTSHFEPPEGDENRITSRILG